MILWSYLLCTTRQITLENKSASTRLFKQMLDKHINKQVVIRGALICAQDHPTHRSLSNPTWFHSLNLPGCSLFLCQSNCMKQNVSKWSVPVLISSFRTKNMLIALLLSQMSPAATVWSMHRQAAPGQWMRDSVVVRQSYGPQVPGESPQSQRGFKHERTCKVSLGASQILNFYSSEVCEPGLWSLMFPQMWGGDYRGSPDEGGADILRRIKKRTGCIRRLRSDGSQHQNKSQNSLLSQATHISAPSHGQSWASWGHRGEFPNFWPQ